MIFLKILNEFGVMAGVEAFTFWIKSEINGTVMI